MARVKPLSQDETCFDTNRLYADHISQYNTRISNMKATLARSQPAFEVYMQWYRLYQEVEKLLGGRLARQFGHAVSVATQCHVCAEHFVDAMRENNEQPGTVPFDEKERRVLAFASAISRNHGHIADHIYSAVSKYFNEAELVLLTAFAGQMIATNIFNSVMETEPDALTGTDLALAQRKAVSSAR